jgi:TPR repeat protein
MPVVDARAQETGSQLGAQDISPLQAQAASGDPAAELKLARAYWQGDGVPENQETAAIWCRKAAKAGNAEAQDFLGKMYLNGQGVERDKKEAVAWFQKAARQGNTGAMCDLGVAYYNGDGVSTDDELSYAWFTVAKGAGSEQGAEAVRRAESELKDWAVANSFTRIAEMYEKRGALPENPGEAARWWLNAARKGNHDAQIQIAAKLFDGAGVTQDFTQGRYWCNEALKANDRRGAYCMGSSYRRGLGVAPNAKEARKWYDTGAAMGDVPSMKALAELEATGEGGRIDRIGACLIYARLAKERDKDALRSQAQLKKEMEPKEWKKVQQQLPGMLIDPKKLDAALQQVTPP